MKTQHARALERLREAAAGLALSDAADAFLASLSTRNLELRGVLEALLMAQRMPPHEYEKRRADPGCSVCGFGAEYAEERLLPSGLSQTLERFRGRHLRPVVADIEIFNSILRTVVDQKRLMEVDGRVRRFELMKALSTVIKSNKAERFRLLEALSRCSILSTPEVPGFLRTFTPWSERSGSETGYFEWPFCWWTAAHGFDAEAVKALFPHAGIDLSPRPANVTDSFDPEAELERMLRWPQGDLVDAEVLRVVFAAGALWIAELKGGRFGLLYKAARRFRWVTGSKEDILASVPDPVFKDAVLFLR